MPGAAVALRMVIRLLNLSSVKYHVRIWGYAS